MKISCIQMNMLLGHTEENFARASALTEHAAADRPDVILLPETWNTGFYPQHGLSELALGAGERVKAEIGALAKKHGVNIIAGSVSDCRGGALYNTAYVFDRTGKCIASYDKTHLFSPMGEDERYTAGNSLCTFALDGVRCGLVICYDIRFPELARSLALKGTDVLFAVSQWPEVRVPQLHALLSARAIENQVFAVCCNSCGESPNTKFGGQSIAIDPLGNIIAKAGKDETILTAELDLSLLSDIRSAIPVFRDRRPELYEI